MAPEQPLAPRPGGTFVEVPERPPVLADGMELIGEYEGSGFRDPPSLVRRPDGQVIQLPDLLYKVAAKADGNRSYEQIAQEVSEEIQRGVDGDSVRFLVDEKLRPLGILAAADGTSPPLQKADPFLGFKFRFGIIPDWLSNWLGSTFRPLFFPLVVLAALVAFVMADAWLFGTHGVAQSMRQTMYEPALFLPLFAAVVLSAAFHEIGHAAGCRYGGGRPGKMGCGLYLAWPAFYTDVTDAYRLGKRARLRTDLGGVYFNMVVVLATVGAYAVTGFEPLLLLAVVQHFEMAHQLLPIVRLDGYYIVADATGVPDLFARIRPILRSMIPGRPPDERVTVLKPWVRVAVTAWVLVVVPLLLFQLFILLHLPRILGTAWDSGSQAFDAMRDAFGRDNLPGGISSALQILILAVPVLGVVLVLARTAHRSSRWVWRRTEGRPVLRTLATLGAAGAATVLLLSWVSPKNYTPIRPGERGTLVEGVRAVRSVTDLPRESPPLDASTTTTTAPAEPTPASTPSTTSAPRRGATEEAPAVTTTVARTTTTEAPAPTTTVARVTTTVG